MPKYEGLIIILKDITLLQPLLKTYIANDVQGCTIMDSEGMTHLIVDSDKDASHFSSLRALLNCSGSSSKTLLIVGNELDVDKAVKITLEVIGDINKPDTGFMLTFPIDSVYGFSKK